MSILLLLLLSLVTPNYLYYILDTATEEAFRHAEYHSAKI